MTDVNLEKEQKIADELVRTFPNLTARVRRARRIMASLEKELMPSALVHLKDNLGFKHLSHMSVVDWIEDEHFEMVYTLWNHEKRVQLTIKTMIPRDNAIMANIDYIWRQANTYQREMREMFGIEFPGFVGEKEFILEDWDDIPPMRREFDTKEYANKTYFHRPGREDAQDVRDTIAKRTGEEIPDFAKKYSREK